MPSPQPQYETHYDTLLRNHGIATPAFIYDEAVLERRVARARHFADQAGCELLYSLKANSVAGVLETIAPNVDGLSCSSVMEARLARAVGGDAARVHFVSPGLSDANVDQVDALCDVVSMNSLSQWQRFGARLSEHESCGLRVNPQLSVVGDPRIDPCRDYSKLGVPLAALHDLHENQPEALKGVSGLHIHTQCGGCDFRALWKTVKTIVESSRGLLSGIEWFNLGGGYHFDKARHASQFRKCVELLSSEYGLAVYWEPGTALVQKAGVIVASVIDLFSSDGKPVAVLDTSVNHLLETYIYDFPPIVRGAISLGKQRLAEDRSPAGMHSYMLAGSTCLAGDLFGEFAFEAPLDIGSTIVFSDVGAYTHALATRYNGENLPSICRLTAVGDLILEKRFGYDEFRDRCGA